jgi:putative DNA methylase
MTTVRKKLIEVALPLEAINTASAREKSIRHGHPSTLHLWWARRPLAAARAVIFAQMVDDPSAHPDIFTSEKAQEKERQRLFRVIEDLVHFHSTTEAGQTRHDLGTAACSGQMAVTESRR